MDIKSHYKLPELKKGNIQKWAKVTANLYKRFGALIQTAAVKDVAKALKNLEANWRIFFKEVYTSPGEQPQAYLPEVRDFEAPTRPRPSYKSRRNYFHSFVVSRFVVIFVISTGAGMMMESS